MFVTFYRSRMATIVGKKPRKERMRRFSDAVVQEGTRILSAMKKFDISRIGFISAVDLAMIALQLGPYRQLPKGSELKSFLVWQHRLYDERIKKQIDAHPPVNMDPGDQQTPASLSPESIAAAVAEWYELHTNDPRAIAALPEEDDRDAFYKTRTAGLTTNQLRRISA